MKKNRLFMMGTLAVMLAFGLVLAGCDDDSGSSGGGSSGGGDGHASALVANWYKTQADADAGYASTTYEFKSDGKLFSFGVDTTITWTTSGGKITLTYLGKSVGAADYTISGTKLTLSNVTGSSPLTVGVYYKKAN